MTVFYVKEIDRLTDFGFTKSQTSNLYYLRTHRAANVCVDASDRRLIIYSPSADAIGILCKMYAEGILEMADTTEHYVNMKVTEEERDAILEMRSKKYGS